MQGLGNRHQVDGIGIETGVFGERNAKFDTGRRICRGNLLLARVRGDDFPEVRHERCSRLSVTRRAVPGALMRRTDRSEILEQGRRIRGAMRRIGCRHAPKNDR